MGKVSISAPSVKSTPGAAPAQIDMHRFETPLGQMVACSTNEGVCLCEFADMLDLESELKELRKLLKANTGYTANPIFGKLEKQLQEYFNGERKEFDIKIHSPGSRFQNQVWNALKNIPYGETRTYKEQAESLGTPDAIRAVAAANGQNRLAILIPCHRVIGSDGSMTGYAGGVWRKKKLLQIEGFKKKQPELFG